MKPTFLVLVGLLITQGAVGAEQSEAAQAKYLYIEEFTVPAGRTINSAIEEGKQWVKIMRETGDFNRVRLYFHHTGPAPAIYILAEPKNWAAIESGVFAPVEELDMMNKPFNWGGHRDNLLTEVVVD